MMMNCYEKSLFEQQTPYLQWLKEEKAMQSRMPKDIQGKQIIRLPFLSCDENVWQCIEREEELAQNTIERLQQLDYVLFCGANGYVDESTEYILSKYLQEHPKEVLVYADEDYLGELSDIYGEDVKEGIWAKEYRYGDTKLYRGYPWFKPDYSPDTLRSFFYIGNIFAIRGRNLAELMCMKEEMPECSVYELVLTLSEIGYRFGHIAKVLFTNQDIHSRHLLCGAQKSFVAMKEKVINARKMQESMFCPLKVLGKIDEKDKKNANVDTICEMQTLCYSIPGDSKVSIIIPSKDHSDVLRRCLTTLVSYTDYQDYELIVVDNGSTEEEQMCIKSLLAEIEEKYRTKWKKLDWSVRYIYEKREFNFSYMCNQGAREATGHYLLFLNDDMEILEPTWLERLVGQATLSHTGAVGAKLWYPNSENDKHIIQHVGITNMGIGPAHKLAGVVDDLNLYHGHNILTYNMLAVTAACLLLRREVYEKVGGFDENLAIAYNDVELCFKIYEAGYYNVQRNDVILLHHESLSRGLDVSYEKQLRLEREKILLYEKHPNLKAKDIFYNPNLVQWKKDVEYSCNYLYPYDKVQKPVVLEQKSAMRLPREHANRLVRKLTGENRALLQIDSEQLEADGCTLVVQGWMAMIGQDNANINKRFYMKHCESGSVYELSYYPMLRKDVAKAIGDDVTRNVELSGFCFVIDTTNLEQGIYIMGTCIEDKSICKRKMCWNHQQLINALQ